MADGRGTDPMNGEGGVVIQFPGSSTTPPPLPRLPRAIPTPGSGVRQTAFFEAALTRRFDREAA